MPTEQLVVGLHFVLYAGVLSNKWQLHQIIYVYVLTGSYLFIHVFMFSNCSDTYHTSVFSVSVRL